MDVRQDSDEEAYLSDPTESAHSEEARTDDDYDYDPGAEPEEGYASAGDSPEFTAAISGDDSQQGTGGAAEEAATADGGEVAAANLTPEESAALSTLNFIINRKATADTSLLRGCTPTNLRQRIGDLVHDKVVHPDEGQLDQLAKVLLPLVAAAAAAGGADGGHSGSGGGANAAGTANGNGAVAPANGLQHGEWEQEVAAAYVGGGGSGAAAAAAESSEGAGPAIDVRGMIARSVSALTRETEAVPATPELPAPPPTTAPSAEAAARPSGLGGAGLGGPGLPARPAARSPAGLGGSGGLPSLPARKVAAAKPPSAPAGLGSGGGLPPPASRSVAAPASSSAAPAAAPAAAAAAPAAAAAAPQAQAQAPALRAAAPGGGAITNPEEPDPEESESVRKLRRKVQDTRVLLVRAALRLGQTPRSSIVQQVVYRLDLAERIHHPARSQAAMRTRGAAAFESACQEASSLEAASPGAALPLSMTVLVMGPMGAGKSETINSLLDDPAAANTAEPTSKVRLVEGAVRGIRMRFIDTPGLHPAASELGSNLRTLNSVKAAFKKYKPDIVLYVDRLDVVRRDMGDLPLLKTITEKFGASVWFNTILVLTHAASPPPEGNNGPMGFDLYAQSRMHMLQNGVRQAAGDMRLLNPVALAENNFSLCRRGVEGEPALPHDGKAWRPHVLLLMLSSKLLSDADEVLDVQGSSQQQQSRAMQFLRGMQQKLPPIPYLLSNFISTKHPRKPPEDEREIRRDDELDELEPDVRKEEVRKKREFLRQRAEEARADEGSTGSQVAVPAPEPALPPSFDAESNSHRYRYLESAGSWIARPFVEAQGLDHDDGIDGFSVERSTMVRPSGQYLGGVPAFVMTQLHKDKNQFSLQGEAEASCYHSAKHVSTATMDVQTIGKDMLYTGKLESRMKVHPQDKVAVGLLASRLKEGYGAPDKGPVAVGMKLENKLKLKHNAKLTMGAGTMSTKSRTGRDTAHAANAELKLKGIVDESAQVLMGGSLMHFRKDLALGGNVAAQFNATPETQVSSRFNLNSKGTGQLVMRVASHDYPHLGLAILVPVLSALVGKLRDRDEAMY